MRKIQTPVACHVEVPCSETFRTEVDQTYALAFAAAFRIQKAQSSLVHYTGKHNPYVHLDNPSQ